MAHILILARDGSSCGHVDYALDRMKEERLDVTLAAPEKKPLNCVVHQGEKGRYGYIEWPGYVIEADAALADIDPSKFDALLLTGGRGPEYLRNNKRAVEIVRYFLENDKPIGAICHGPHMLLAAGMTGRRMTAIHDIKFDVVAAGNTYVEKRDEPVVDGNVVTGFGPLYYHVWIGAFLDLLKERGIIPSDKKTSSKEKTKTRILITTGPFTSSGQLQHAKYRMLEAGFEVIIAAPKKERIDTIIDMREEGWDDDVEKPGYRWNADAAFEDVDPSTFNGLLIPGWRATEYLRYIKPCVDIVRYFVDNDKPIGAICQGPRLLIAAGVKERRMTGQEVIKIDIARANTYVDAGGDPVVDGNIVTVSGRPYYSVWTRAFMALLKERGITPS